VDFSRLKPSDWLMVGGALVMLIFGLALDWAEVGGFTGNNAFDYFFTGGLAWILTVGVGVVALLLALETIKRDSAPWPLILVLASGLATVLMLLRLLIGGGEEQGVDLDRAAGMWVAFLAAGITLTGALVNFTASGGKLSDLTDMDKMRDAFDRPGGGSPPPPPPPSAPPPPPAPPSPPPPPPPPAP
jgi:hypothetical protein